MTGRAGMMLGLLGANLNGFEDVFGVWALFVFSRYFENKGKVDKFWMIDDTG